MKRLLIFLLLFICVKAQAIEIVGDAQVKDSVKTDFLVPDDSSFVTISAFKMWGLWIDTTGMAEDEILILNATKDSLQFEAQASGADGQNADSIMGKAVSQLAPTDDYILKWDAGADSIMWEADGGAGFIAWSDTVNTLVTVSDTTVTSGYIASKLSIADTSSFSNQFALKLAIADTAPLHNQIVLKLDISDTSSFSNQFAERPKWSDTTNTIVTVSDTTVLSAQFALYLALADTNYTDSSDVKGWNFMNEDSAMYATQTDLGDYLALADTNYTDSTDVKGWNYMNEDSAMYATQTDLGDYLALADTNYTDSTDVKGWNFMNEDSAMYATQTDIATMTEDGDTATWLATATDIATMTEDGDSSTWLGTKTNIATLSLQGKKQLVFAVDDPKNLTHDSTFVWTNRSGHTFTIDSIFSQARQDDYDYDLVESACEGGTVTLIESITVTQNGTAWFWESVTAIDHAAIETGKGVLFVQSADSTDCITCTIYGSYTD